MLTLIAEMPPLTLNADSVILVGGTRVTLETVIGSFKDGISAEEIAQQYPRLTLADIYGAIVYYLAHQSEVEDYLRSVSSESQQVQSQNENRFDPVGVRARLLARRSNEPS